jgi:hypothetical protein
VNLVFRTCAVLLLAASGKPPLALLSGMALQLCPDNRPDSLANIQLKSYGEGVRVRPPLKISKKAGE